MANEHEGPASPGPATAFEFDHWATASPAAGVPLALAQRRIWFLSSLADAGAEAYVVSVGMRLRGALDASALRQALDLLLRRHDALRARITLIDGEPLLHFEEDPQARFALIEDDLRGAADPAADLDALVEAEFAAPFDFARGPLIRGRLIQLGADEHVWLLTVHHVVFDGSSMYRFARELGMAYRALRSGSVPALEPPRRYAECLAIQRSEPFAERLRAQAAFWRETLRGAPLLSTLPPDRPRGPRHDFDGALVDWQLSAELTAQLRALAKRQRTTVFCVVLAAWAVLLQRLNQQDEAVIGVSTSGRTQREFRDVVGCFVGTVPVRIGSGLTPAEAIRQTTERLRAATDHQDLPFEQIVEAASAERNLAQNPLFQTLVNWYRSDLEPFAFGDAERLPLPSVARKYALADDGTTLHPARRDALIVYGATVERVSAKLDVTLLIWEAAGRIDLGIEYARALYDRSTVERHLACWTRLLEAFVADDTQLTARIPLVDAAERQRLVHEWNATTVALPHVTVPELIAATAARMPQATALQFRDTTLSYTVLRRDARRVASRLRAYGIGAGHRVAISIERSVELVVALLGVLECAAAYVPLDPHHPLDRRRYVLRDAGASALLVRGDSDLVAHVGGDVRVIDLAGSAGWTEAEHDMPARPATPQDLAYVIYTSGTTGRPKGVMVEHAGVVNLLLAMRDCVALAPGERVLALTTIGFDIAALEIFLPLIAGGCIVLAERAAAQDPQALAALLEQQHVDLMQATPTTWRMLLDAGWHGRPTLRALCGGEALPTDVAARIAQRVAALWNVYGPTETTIWSSAQRIDRDIAADISQPTACIGKPLANTQAYVLDRNGELVPTGIAGELYLGGIGLARGYVGLDALTRERFVANPFDDATRLYRTGDLASWDQAGRLHHGGRTDAQVKFNGYRIELEEIEARLGVHPLVLEAAVALRHDASGYARLVAYYVPAVVDSDVVQDHTDDLRRHLLAFLPSYMVPDVFVVLERLPVSANGKIDRIALPEPLAVARGGHEAPRPGVENEIAAIWSELLDGRLVDRRDNFFRLGGHSLLAVRVIVRLQKRLGVDINVTDLFAHPTLEAFAAVVACADRAALPPLRLLPRAAELPLSSAQQRLWFVAQTGSAASRAYHMPIVLRLRGALDRAALQRAVTAVVTRHEALRTVFPTRGGRPVQQIIAAEQAAVVWRIAELPADISDAATAAFIVAEVDRAFDLRSDLPLRVALLPLDHDDHIVVFTIHHIACDGWSLSLFLHELQAHYAAARVGAVASLPALPVQYADYSAWERLAQDTARFARATTYWTQRLAGAPDRFELPTDRPRPARQDFSGDFVACEFGAALTSDLHKLAECCGATLFMTALAAWVALLARLSGARDFVVGTPTANRDSAETEHLIGFFANALALRFELPSDPSIADLVAFVRSEVLAAQQHRELPFEQVVEALRPTRSAAHTPVFQIAFAWQSVPPVALAFDGLETTQRFLVGTNTAKFDITVYLWQSEQGLAGGIEYATALYDRATIARYLEHWRVLLEAFVRDPQQRLTGLPLLSAAQRDGLLATTSSGPVVAFEPCRVHRLVENVARRQPDAVALTQRERTLSYSELDRRAEHLADVLAAQGTGAGARVGVLLPRSPEMVIALLGVLKAGAAYVLLDPTLPAQRLARLLIDANARLLVSDAVAPREFGESGLAIPHVRVDGVGTHDTPAPAVVRDVERDDDIAYVVYTSGSTGVPKGVLITHRGFANVVQAVRAEFDIRPGDLVSCACGLAFDATTIDIWPALCAGATLALTPVELAHDADAFLDWWRSQPLRCSLLPTPIAEIILARGLAPPTLRTLATGGAALTRLPPPDADYRLLNVYGPAEASVVTSIGEVRHGDRITIGRPIANLRVHILDDAGRPQPLGIPGELYVGGIGVGAGYLGLPELNERLFLPDPFSNSEGARLYRSGDRARWLADGRIEFLGRRDEQVKLRGMRIELGEIETCLGELTVVREAAVALVTNAAGEARLVAYVAMQEGPADDAAVEDERIASWQRVYDDTYSGPNRDELVDFDGWNSSYTGEAIPLAEMRDWQSETVARVRELAPRRVLEIGCGSGLLLLPLAAGCERYVGVDLSAQALHSLQRKIERVGLRGVELVHARADELRRLPAEQFDTIIINSVAQYFPDRAYLDRVVADALVRLEPGGALFIGDLRSQLLAEAFHTAVQRARTGNTGRAAESADHVRRAVAQEKELLVAPAYFRRLADEGRALQVLPKVAPNANELTAFRYDVVVRDAAATEKPRCVFDASDASAVADAIDWVRAHPDSVAIVTPLRNALVADALGDEGMASTAGVPTATPAQMTARVAAAGLAAQASWIGSDTRGTFHLLIAIGPDRLRDHVHLLREYAEPADVAPTNSPTRLETEAQWRRQLAVALAPKLPEYMIPTQFVFLPQLPLSPNGKVDRARLPVVELPRSAAFRPLQTTTERQVAAIWSDVLGNDVVGANDHFFELGGHSLAAVQVLARVRETFGIEMALAGLFAHPVLADFAEVVDGATPAQAQRIGRVSRAAPLPLSFEQEGLWFLAKLPGAAAAYNMIVVHRLEGALDIVALGRAVDALVQRHEALRTRFGEIDGRPVMHTDAETLPVLRHVDIEGGGEARLQELLDEEIDRQFDLESSPPVRFSLLREREQCHVLLLSMHHILGDGWSIDVLLRNLGRFYDHEIDTSLPPPAPLAIQYADFAAAQRGIEMRRLEALAAHWRGVLEGAPPLLELPVDRLRPTQQDFRGGFLPCRLDAALSERVHRASRRFGTTPFVLLLTSWALLLSRLSGQEDLVIGVPSANRATRETQELVGLFVSTLPLRLDLSGEPLLSTLLKQTERRMLDAQQHQDIAFEKIVELVCSSRSLAHNPLFQVMFAWQGERPEPLQLHGIAAASLVPDCSPRHAKFDLSLILVDDVNDIHGGIEFASALFDETTIARYREYWLAILAQLVQGEDLAARRIELLSPAQRAQMVETWNATERAFPHDRCLHQLFEAQAAASPDATALEFENQRLSYAELDRRAGRLAARLRADGLRVGDFVAIHIARSPAMIVAVLAVLKAGGAYVPLDTTHPRARKRHILEDCRPGWLLHAGDAPSLDALAEPPRLVDVDADSDAPAVAVIDAVSTQLAYVIYTSGSTGQPKGVMVEHRSVVNRLDWMRRHFPIEATDAVLQKTALGFDVSVWEIFVPLICGARLVLADAGAQADPERLTRVLRERRITVAHFVPSMLHLFLAQFDATVLPDLRHVVCSGEELPPTVVEDFQDKLPRTALYNLYGPTEASIEVSWHRCELDHSAVRVPIGRPIDNCRLYVLDRHQRPLPTGVTGELYIAGLPVARGYFNRAALTAERFLPDPFVADAGARMYKTGDQARWLPNGEIDFLGRNDAQIKLRGFRIELSDIESHFARFPGIDEAAVALRHDPALGPALVGYWAGDDAIGVAALRDYLAAAVPDYMVPTFFVRLDALPLSANGKLDRAALPAPLAAAVETTRAPAGEVEQRIAAAWHDVLGRSGIGRDDNFFAVGGHSLLTLRLRTRLQAAGFPVEITDLFRHPTIAALAQALNRRGAATALSAATCVRAEGSAPPLFLLHDGFGLNLYAHVLAARLPAGFPIYALDEVAPVQDESASIPLLADRLRSVLRSVQPHGPYRLAGWSFGGLLAYELATQLLDAGEKVDYLGMIDSYYRFDEPTTDARPAEFTEVPLHVAALGPARQQDCLARHEIYALAARRYAARPLHLPVDLIKAQRCDFPPMTAYRGWERVLPAEAIRVQQVPGCHYSMMTQEFIAATAAALARGLLESR